MSMSKEMSNALFSGKESLLVESANVCAVSAAVADAGK